MKIFYKITFSTLIFLSTYIYSELRIEITGGTNEPIRVAMVPLEWTIKTAPSLYLHEVVKKELESFGEFSVLSPEDMLSYPTLEGEVSYRDWRLLKVDYLIIGSVLESEVIGEVKIAYSILDVSRQKNIHKALISGSLKSKNRS
jgi:TolB protein